MAFDKLDKERNGCIDPADMIGVYDTTHHPDVLSRKKTSQQVLREFLNLPTIDALSVPDDNIGGFVSFVSYCDILGFLAVDA